MTKQNTLITTDSAINNLIEQAGLTKQASLLFTASIIMTFVAFTKERQDEAYTAIRGAVVKAGYIKLDKGTKQPSDKARRFIKCAEAAFTNHHNKLHALMLGKSVSQQTTAIAEICESFALSVNHYEGDVYLMPLTLGLSKKACLDKLRAKAQKIKENANEDVEESEVTTIPAKGSKGKAASTKQPDARKVVDRAQQVAALPTALLNLLSLDKGQTPSKDDARAVIRTLSELGDCLALVKGDKVPHASKTARRLAVQIAKFEAIFRADARLQAKNADLKAKKQASDAKAEKKAA